MLVQQGSDVLVIIQLPVHHLCDSRGRHPLGHSLLDLADEWLEGNGFPLRPAQGHQEFPHGRRIELPLIPQSQYPVQCRRRDPRFLGLHNRLGEARRPAVTVRRRETAQESRSHQNAREAKVISAFHDRSPPSILH